MWRLMFSDLGSKFVMTGSLGLMSLAGLSAGLARAAGYPASWPGGGGCEVSVLLGLSLAGLCAVAGLLVCWPDRVSPGGGGVRAGGPAGDGNPGDGNRGC